MIDTGVTEDYCVNFIGGKRERVMVALFVFVTALDQPAVQQYFVIPYPHYMA